ncbi:hypothetical protein BC826DRAFT_906654 [Russula brevipes]|nr:hypothetical protein BC826DRAFT_917829 [Russula brevipes]KAI0298825.1 hypothetical protein BC826DRAFT_906654 [Russula brevipes]
MPPQTTPDLLSPLPPSLLFATPPPVPGSSLSPNEEFPAAQRRRVLEPLDTNANGSTPYVEVYTPQPQVPQWTSASQAEFSADMCNLMIACNISWFHSANPFFRNFFSKWVPGSTILGPKQLSGRVLDELAEKVVDETRSTVKGQYSCGQSDGWKNVAKVHMIGSMLNVEYTPHLLNAVDVSAKRKTAGTLLEIVESEMKYATEVLMTVLVGWCTDASGDSSKMRKLLRSKYPWLVTLDCWAHQVFISHGLLRRRLIHANRST